MDNPSKSSSLDELLFHYVGLKAQIRALQHELRDTYPSVVEAMQDSNEKHEIGGAIVTYSTRKKYKFSDSINALSEELSVRKKTEIETGVAEVESETGMVSVRFKKSKD